ncbi:hypothetical protein AB0A95_30625 [Micromonospora sp. NPDC049230]|uniref:hypothetical protein n=1 Tax=Micromonospora sp. NPDC049230 TaxID=3155502 RepID=UPI0033D204F2
MTNPRELWIGGVFAVDWDLTVTGTVVVSGTVQKPDQTPASMTIDHANGSSTWRASYSPTSAGEYGYRLTATVDGAAAGATGGTFLVNRDRTGAPPITLNTVMPIGMIRLLITDTDEAFPLFTDEEIGALLAIEGGVVKRGAAAALETIATSETLIGKKITTQDLSTDGPAVAKELMARARSLRDQADVTDGVASDPYSYGFDFVDINTPGGWL